MSGIYSDGSYLERNRDWHQRHSPWKARMIHKIIEANRINPKTVCEVGCGAGEILCQLSELMGGSAGFFGYEISRDAFELCSKKAGKNISFFMKDIVNEPDRSFDLALFIDVVEHVEDYYGFLRKARGLAAYKAFHFPLDLSAQAVLRKGPLMDCRRTSGHLHYFSKDTALAALSDTGYEILDYFYAPGSLELPAAGLASALMRAPRRALFALNQDLASRMLGGFSLMILAK